jgi:hypothetical protein
LGEGIQIEKDLSAEGQAAEADARLSQADAHPRRARGNSPAQAERQEEADCVGLVLAR